MMKTILFLPEESRGIKSSPEPMLVPRLLCWTATLSRDDWMSPRLDVNGWMIREVELKASTDARTRSPWKVEASILAKGTTCCCKFAPTEDKTIQQGVSCTWGQG